MITILKMDIMVLFLERNFKGKTSKNIVNSKNFRWIWLKITY